MNASSPELNTQNTSPNSTPRRFGAMIVSAAITLESVFFGASADSISQCETPSNMSIEQVTQLMDHPPQLPIPQIPDNVPNRDQYGRTLISDEMQAKEKALGISYPTVDRKVLDSLESAAISQHSTPPFKLYMQAAQSVLDNYGIKLGLSPTLDGSTSALTPTPAQLESATAINEIAEIMNFFSNQPRQLIKLAGKLHEIDLTAKGTIQGFGKFGGEALTGRGVMLVDVVNNDSQDFTTVPHEFFHFLFSSMMGRLCNGDNSTFDDTYANLNSSSTYANEWPLPKNYLSRQPASFGAVQKQYYQLLADAESAKDRGDSAGQMSITAKANSLISSVEMESDYSYYNVTEDEAEIGKEIFSRGEYGFILDKHDPVRRKKFIRLMSLLYIAAPNVVQDFALNYGLEFSPYGSK